MRVGPWCWVLGLVVGAAALVSAHAAPLTESEYGAGDVMLAASVPGAHPIYQLWPGDGKRADDPKKELKEVFDRRVKNVSRPTVMWMKPENPNGKAVLVFPGGGYGHLAARKEGSTVGEWLNKQGISAFVVKYRVPRRAGVNAPLQDAQRAIRWVRANAKEFGVSPNQVGVLGFSAGGHLSAMTVHHFAKASYEPTDDVDKLSCKPSFAALIYPAYLGKAGKVADEFSEVADVRIPVYIAISRKDKFHEGVEAYVPVLKKAGVKYDYHAYPDGGHGTGLGGFPWIESCEKWLSQLGE